MDPKNSKQPDVDRTPVAQEIWCYSPKEKAFTWHVVVNHDIHGFVDRVMCKTTKTIHKYKRHNKPESVSAARKTIVKKSQSGVSLSSAPKASSTPSAVLEEQWWNGIKAWGDKVVRDFDPSKSFNKGEVFNHSVFGKGVVQTRRDNKIDVLFKEGLKTLPSAKS